MCAYSRTGPIRCNTRLAVSGMVSQIGASASRAITLLTASTDTEPKAGKMWFSREESHESLCRLFAQPPLSALWQARAASANRSEEHTSELQSLMRNSFAVFCLTKKQESHILAHMLVHTYQHNETSTQ